MRRMSIQFCFGALLNLVAVNIFIFLSEMDYGGIIALLPLIVAFFIMRSFMIYVFSPDDDVSVGQVISLGSLVFAVSSLIEATIIFSTSKNMYSAILFAFCLFFSETYPLLEKIYITRRYSVSQIWAHGIYIFQAIILVCIIAVMILRQSNYLELYLLLAVISCIIDFVLICLPSAKKQ